MSRRAELWRVAGAVPDPELPVISLAELGVLRGLSLTADGRRAEVTLTPTYTGCPAVEVMRADIGRALHRAGVAEVRVHTVLAPPWSTDDITEDGLRKLHAAGIAPPRPASGPVPVVGPVPVEVSSGPPRSPAPPSERGPTAHGTGPGPTAEVPSRAAPPSAIAPAPSCPRCGSTETTLRSRFSGTACKALRRCESCREPFDHMRPH